MILVCWLRVWTSVRLPRFQFHLCNLPTMQTQGSSFLNFSLLWFPVKRAWTWLPEKVIMGISELGYVKAFIA